MNKDGLISLMQKYNLRPNFTYGQNFLIDDIVLEDVVDAAKVAERDVVLEIGPGIGNLTRKLLQRGCFVLSVEKDPKFLPILKAIKKDFPKTFRYEIADILKFNFQETLLTRSGYADSNPDIRITADSKHPQASADPDAISKSGSDYKVVANIPYYITGKILRMFMSAKVKPENITVLTQKEVARNVIAQAGDLSLLAISVQLYGKPDLVLNIPARNFYPAPKVDSALLRIELFDKPKYNIGDEKKFFSLLRACFSGKRKQIHNTLINNAGLPKEKTLAVLAELKLDPKVRPQELTIEQWVELAKRIFNF